MKSIKPGRGPSMMSGIMSIAMAVFGLIWTILAGSMGGGLFALFGIVFIAIAIAQAIYNFKNATNENRYSAFDITDSSEETDPLNEFFGQNQSYNTKPQENPNANSNFCPYCGTKVAENYSFCNRCGKQLP